MNNLLYFILEGKKLYLDEVFVDFNDLPLYFSCISNGQYYLCLCCDYDKQNYVVVESSAEEIAKMLSGEITMRSTFVCKARHWLVISGEDASLDKITLVSAPYLEESVLPKEGAKYTIATEKIKRYLLKIKNELYSDTFFTTIEMKAPPLDANKSQIENFEVTTPIDTYMGCYSFKFKPENLAQTSPIIPFIYEKIDNPKFDEASNMPFSYNQTFGVKKQEERSIAA